MTITEEQLTIKPVSLYNTQVQQMIAILDRYQLFLYGQQHVNLEPVDQLQKNNAFMLGAFASGKLIGIGAVKIQDNYGEIKRMFVEKKHRGTSAAAAILNGLEAYTRQQNKTAVKLETGRLQFAAIGFYEKQGYWEIAAFGKYRTNPVSIYFQKDI